MPDIWTTALRYTPLIVKFFPSLPEFSVMRYVREFLQKTNATHHSNSISNPNETQHHCAVIFTESFMDHMLSEIEIGNNEPDEQNDGAEAHQVESHLPEEGHVEHVREAADAVVIPFLEVS